MGYSIGEELNTYTLITHTGRPQPQPGIALMEDEEILILLLEAAEELCTRRLASSARARSVQKSNTL